MSSGGLDLAPRVCGRFAPSPTGALHLGNLRTALVSWLHARAGEGRWLVRMEDLDRVTSSHQIADAQLATLERLGLSWDGEVVFQSERFARYDEGIEVLQEAGRVYPCFCTRREIAEAASAPHDDAPRGTYPGTCRDLSLGEVDRLLASGRRPAMRLRTDHDEIAFDDHVVGHCVGNVDDVVLRRNDGVPAYNLAVVVDDADQGVTDVVRGDDLLTSTPRQILLQRLLGLPTPSYAHVPLVLGPDGTRLAKRHGAVSLEERLAAGATVDDVLDELATSLRLAEPGERLMLDDLVRRFRFDRLARDPWRLQSRPQG